MTSLLTPSIFPLQNLYSNTAFHSYSTTSIASTSASSSSSSSSASVAPSASTSCQTSTKSVGYAEGEEDPMVHMTSTGPLPVTTTLNIVDTKEADKWPVFRVMDPQGRIIPGAPVPNIDEATAKQMYQIMGRIQALDDVFYNAQRQGRISFYMQNAGEEAAHVGSASGISNDDVVLAQYREVGVLLWRGFQLQQAADQCFSNISDLGRGRQMPVHYGSKELNFQTISSPLTTQLPQAVGAAYAMKMSKQDRITIVYFGEGAASEGDFHAALNFASTLEVPMIFFCRNNGYAISTPVKDQYRGDGIVARAAGYGMHGIRVDGNDVFAVKMATEQARKLALEKNCPVLIEAMTYRRGHHSTSDDSTRYRSISEIKHWHDNFDPVSRLRLFMESKGWWNAEAEQNMRDRERYNNNTPHTPPLYIYIYIYIHFYILHPSNHVYYLLYIITPLPPSTPTSPPLHPTRSSWTQNHLLLYYIYIYIYMSVCVYVYI